MKQRDEHTKGLVALFIIGAAVEHKLLGRFTPEKTLAAVEFFIEVDRWALKQQRKEIEPATDYQI